MKMPRLTGLAVLLCVLPSAAAATGARDPAKPDQQTEAFAGVVVEKVAKNCVGDRAGLVPGDVIVSWTRAASPPENLSPAEGRVSSPFDLEVVRVEESPRGIVSLHGHREGKGMSWILPPGWWWGFSTRPLLAEEKLRDYLAGRAAIERGDFATAEQLWRGLAQRAEGRQDIHLAAWVEFHLGWIYLDHDVGARAERLGSAISLLRALDRPLVALIVAYEQGRALLQQSELERAQESVQRVLDLADQVPRNSFALGWLQISQATSAKVGGDLPRARQLLTDTLASWEAEAPGSLNLAPVLNSLGILAAEQGDLSEAERRWRRALGIVEILDPVSLDHAVLLENLGLVEYFRGDLDRAEASLEKSRAVASQLRTRSEMEAETLTNLATVAIARGDLVQAEEILRRALAFAKSVEKNPIFPTVLESLGAVACARGDLASADAYLRRALDVREQDTPSWGEPIANTLTALAEISARRGEWSEARNLLGRALKVREKDAPNSFRVAEILLQLGDLEVRGGGDLAAAEARLRRALELAEAQLPESLLVAKVWLRLGRLAERRGETGAALPMLERVLALFQRIAPGSALEAEALNSLGHTEIAAGKRPAGAAHLCQAIDVLERQRPRVGGTQEGAAAFEAASSALYQECLEARWALGEEAVAFHVLERGRARAFLRLLTERDLRFEEVSPEVRSEQGRLRREYDQLQESLGKLSLERDAGEIERLTVRLRDIQARQASLAARLRQQLPRLAAFEDSAPLDANAAGQALDRGTVLLAYAVGESRSLLFVLSSTQDGGPGLVLLPLPLGRIELQREMESFRALLGNAASDPEIVLRRAEHLYDQLLAPAAIYLQDARRLLISPDGPLHALPFAALTHRGHYLAERMPLHIAPSVTVYAKLRRPLSGATPGATLVAFGDPHYPRQEPVSRGDAEVRSALARGLTLQPLPSSRAEVEAIAAGDPNAKVFLGSAATEEQAKSMAPSARRLHFACHGLFDERFPLNSGLALSIPESPAEGQENGLLQAWEIFESLRLDADLVTLSACDTALGKDAGGEGILGLTRAFQFAGARSVLASLWSVSDLSTADLMKRFYGHLRAGKTKDEALQAAQVELIRSPEFSHPYYWAAFQLFGDWK